MMCRPMHLWPEMDKLTAIKAKALKTPADTAEIERISALLAADDIRAAAQHRDAARRGIKL